jgi:hypothetical protein
MLLLSTGCGVKIDGKDYVLFKSNEKNNIFENMHSESSVSKEISAERENSEELSINNNSGNIEIESELLLACHTAACIKFVFIVMYRFFKYAFFVFKYPVFCGRRTRIYR